MWCTKLDALLTFSGKEYEMRQMWPPFAPRGKLPIISLTGGEQGAGQGTAEESIPDSEHAYNELVRRGLVQDLDEGLSEEQKALSMAINGLCEFLTPLILRERWIDQYYFTRDNRVIGPLKSVPRPFNYLVARIGWKKQKAVSAAAGHDKRTPAELASIRSQTFAAIATFVGDKKYVHGGNKPTRVDALLFGILTSIVSFPGIEWNPLAGTELLKHKNLIRYVVDIRKEWFPNREPLPVLEDA
jgi:hypothetical protein